MRRARTRRATERKTALRNAAETFKTLAEMDGDVEIEWGREGQQRGVCFVCFVLTPVSRHNAPCHAKIENDLRNTQQMSYNTTFTETETGTDVTATGERP